jgi:hypothetical protein
MARPLKREMRDTPFRCLDNGHLFTEKVEWLGHDSEEGGSQDIKWVIGKVGGVTCPYCHTHRIELVEE